MPKTVLGKWSIIFVIAVPVLFFIGSTLSRSLYQSVPAGNSIGEDIIKRPALAITMLAGSTSGIFAFALGLLAIVKQKERALLVYLSTLLGTMLLIFIFGEILSPH